VRRRVREPRADTPHVLTCQRAVAQARPRNLLGAGAGAGLLPGAGFYLGMPSCSPTCREGLEFLAFGSRELAKLCKRGVQVLRLLFPVPRAPRASYLATRSSRGSLGRFFGRVARAASSRSACDSMPKS
jgi:hypothetical protein